MCTRKAKENNNTFSNGNREVYIPVTVKRPGKWEKKDITGYAEIVLLRSCHFAQWAGCQNY